MSDFYDFGNLFNLSTHFITSVYMGKKLKLIFVIPDTNSTPIKSFAALAAKT